MNSIIAAFGEHHGQQPQSVYTITSHYLLQPGYHKPETDPAVLG